jgi:cell volume regulation protein A
MHTNHLHRLERRRVKNAGLHRDGRTHLLSCDLILAVGTVTGLLAQKIKIPDVAVFLVAGIAIGPQALDLIDIKADSALNQIILLFGASYILFDGGASMS